MFYIKSYSGNLRKQIDLRYKNLLDFKFFEILLFTFLLNRT